MLITISGLPGSGKTTVARLVARALDLEHMYAGDLFRRQAEAAGLLVCGGVAGYVVSAARSLLIQAASRTGDSRRRS